MKERISESAAILPPEVALRELPDVVTAIILGAKTTENYRNGDGVHIKIGNDEWHLALHDFAIASEVACELNAQLQLGRFADGMEVLSIRRHADREIRERIKPSGEKSVAMLKDKGSSGWWRMVLPARMMKKDGWRFDCTAAPVNFDHLLQYDTIFVQRIHDWESYYTLERLKDAGKRIVYDIDDDLFNITPDNPAYNTITRDDQLAAANCMKLADVVTTTTGELQRRLTGVMDGVSPVVVPNAWDVDDNWTPTPMTGSPDGMKRILWSGGASHGKDWEVCFDAVSSVMFERDDVLLVILGYLPPCIERAMHLPQFKGRIEFCGFRDPETYYNLIHHVRADVGLAPVQHTSFNAAKCLVGDTRIVTDSGIIPIRDIADEKNEVWQESSWESVEATVSYEDVSTIRLRTKKGYVIEGTPHHRLRSEGEFTAMSELGLGMKVDLSFFEFPNVPMVEIPMPLLWTKKLDKVNWETCRDDLMPRVPITKEWGRFMGLLLGDGHLGGSNDVRISCDGQESDVIEWIHDFVAGIGLNSSVKVKGSPRNVDVSIPSRSLRWLLSKIVGFHSGREKVLRVPDIIWRSPKDVVREFLRGLFEADGCACKGHIGLTSKERLLVEDVQFLLLGFGILSRIKTDYNKFYKKEYYTIIMQRQACDVFADTIGFMSKRKNDKLREIVERPHSNAFKPWEMNDEVVEIEKYNGKTVYDIQVPNGEYYMANGIVSHNSPIKFLEYSLMGVPTVASDWEPYQSVIEDGLNGALVTKQGWITEIERFLCDDDLRKGTVKEARKTCQMFDLKQVANTWADLLCP